MISKSMNKDQKSIVILEHPHRCSEYTTRQTAGGGLYNAGVTRQRLTPPLTLHKSGRLPRISGPQVAGSNIHPEYSRHVCYLPTCISQSLSWSLRWPRRRLLTEPCMAASWTRACLRAELEPVCLRAKLEHVCLRAELVVSNCLLW